jgi:hypothetical protein
MTPAQRFEIDYKQKGQNSVMSSISKEVCFDISKIEYSWKDKKKGIILPEKMTSELAYLVGVHIGDGTMNIYQRKNQVDYFYELCGHAVNDKLFHDSIMLPLFEKLFNIETKDRANSLGCIGINIRSKAFVTFLHDCVGLPLGKKDGIDIPQTIFDSGLECLLACISGIFDTDFSLSFKNKNKTLHKYPVISLNASSQCLINTISSVLTEVGISNFTHKRVVEDSRLSKPSVQFSVTCSGEKNLIKWFNLVGSKNPSYISRYSIWRKFGFCPPNTDYLMRRKILLGQIDPKELCGYGQGET